MPPPHPVISTPSYASVNRDDAEVEEMVDHEEGPLVLECISHHSSLGCDIDDGDQSCHDKSIECQSTKREDS